AGEDAQMFATLTLGGTGAIAASAHWRAAEFVELMALLRGGQLAEARRVWQALLPWVEMCFAEPNPAPLKAVLAQAGWMRNELRTPMMPASEALIQSLQRLQAVAEVSRP
ncbi:MAG TPA: dihydrodipicolinate synthase family protein, partial [Acidovorax sp.]|nr:dihydrodipicolinate synthase family protein [Acidovorax sp.]